MLRVISGKLRNRQVDQPPLEITRSTKEIVRESIFSSLYDRVQNSIILDLCAGSGVMGFEAISRGAAKVLTVDSSIESIKVIKKNILNLGITNCDVYYMDAIDFLEHKKGSKFDIIIFDPPFRDYDLYNNVLKLVVDYSFLKNNSLFILETDNLSKLIFPKNLTIYKEKKFGKSIVLFLSKIT